MWPLNFWKTSSFLYFNAADKCVIIACSNTFEKPFTSRIFQCNASLYPRAANTCYFFFFFLSFFFKKFSFVESNCAQLLDRSQHSSWSIGPSWFQHWKLVEETVRWIGKRPIVKFQKDGDRVDNVIGRANVHWPRSSVTLAILRPRYLSYYAVC